MMAVFRSFSVCTSVMYSMSVEVTSCGKPLKRTPASLLPSKSTLMPPSSFASVSGNFLSFRRLFLPASTLSAMSFS